jgi:hypothetical protein
MCKGYKKIEGKEKNEEVDCPVCSGEGVLWKLGSPKAGDRFTKEQ